VPADEELPRCRRERDEQQRKQRCVVGDVDRVAALDREVEARYHTDDGEAERCQRDGSAVYRVARERGGAADQNYADHRLGDAGIGSVERLRAAGEDPG
jgi:hypothetical protein